MLLHVNNLIHSLKAGELCLIPPELSHKLETSGGYLQLGINLRTEPDQRGLTALLSSRFRQVYMFKRSAWLARLPEWEEECRKLTPMSKLKVAHWVDELLLSCMEESPGEAAEPFKSRLLQLLTAHLGQRLSLNTLSRDLAVSPSSLERLCRKEFGCGAMELHNRMRMNEACGLLADASRSVESIALSLGFFDAAHFSRSFKQRMGMSPLQYRREHGD